ncbi:hypothetical protein KS868_004573 [Vibrio parahaemolyticus]|nr:hypothetical protein [Vibrio parahaemolyticus]
MKLKNIKGVAKNFTLSFFSGENYIDGGFVRDDIFKLANLKAGDLVRISWIPTKDEELFKLTPRLRKTVLAYRKWLPKLCESHSLPIECFEEFYISAYRADNHQVYVEAVVVDLNGKIYQLPIWV